MRKNYNIQDFEMMYKFIRKGRIYVKISHNGITLTMPQANYTWLCGNPSFVDIPKGYVVHHLDHNPTNDDLSNLCIMFKHHHHAHHLKDQKVIVELELNEEINESFIFDIPVSKPRLVFIKKRGYYKLRYNIESGGKKRQREIYRVSSKRITSVEQGDEIIKKIWPSEPWVSNDTDRTVTVKKVDKIYPLLGVSS